MEKYDPQHVADLMFAKKERKIPGSVMKPHNPNTILIKSNVMKMQNPHMRTLFPYPQYCYRIQTMDSFLRVVDYAKQYSESENT